MKQSSYFLLLLLFSGLYMACNDPTIVGSDLLNEEGLNINFSDTVQVRMKTIKGDSVKTLNNNSAAQSVYILGELNDPYFGHTKTGVYSEIHLNSSTPDYENAVLDSAVLVISYDTLGFYGDTLQAFDVKVFQLNEKLTEYDSLYSNASLERMMIPLGERNGLVVNKRDSVGVYDPSQDSVILTPAHLRIPIDYSWAEQIFLDTAAVNSDSTLVDLVKGIYLEASGSNDGGFIGLSIGASLSRSELIMYYTKEDTLKRKYAYRVLGRRHIEIQHDYTGSPVEEAIDDFLLGEEHTYLQSMAGVNIEVDLSNISALGDVLINKAELEFTVANLPDDNIGFYPPIRDIIASKRVDGNVTLIDDVITAINLGSLETYFGGRLNEEEVDGITLQKYSLNVTNFAIKVLDGEEEPTIIISASIKSERPNRSIIFGPGHFKYPARLKLTYTSL